MRTARSTVPGLVHHVIARFVDKRRLIRDEEEREAYLALLGRAMTSSDWRCLAYAIMSSHLHLAMVAGHTPSERWTRRVHPRFASWLNERHGGLGSVFAGRCAMWAVRPKDEAALISYIHNNPVRANIVRTARDSTWTSHRAYAGLAAARTWLHVEEGLARSGLAAPAFDSFVAATHGTSDAPALEGVHREARKHGAIQLGTPIVGDRVEAPILVRRFTHLKPLPPRVVAVTAEVLGIRPAVLAMRTRDAAAPRAIAIHAARELGIAVASISVALGVTPQSGSRLAMRTLDDGQRACVLVIAERLRDELGRSIAERAKGESVPS